MAVVLLSGCSPGWPSERTRWLVSGARTCAEPRLAVPSGVHHHGAELRGDDPGHRRRAARRSCLNLSIRTPFSGTRSRSPLRTANVFGEPLARQIGPRSGISRLPLSSASVRPSAMCRADWLAADSKPRPSDARRWTTVQVFPMSVTAGFFEATGTPVLSVAP